MVQPHCKQLTFWFIHQRPGSLNQSAGASRLPFLAVFSTLRIQNVPSCSAPPLAHEANPISPSVIFLWDSTVTHLNKRPNTKIRQIMFNFLK